MDKIVPIAKYASKRDLVVQALREMILSGKIVPGQRLRQDELSRMLGVSATPIREAIRLLEAEGLLVGEPHRGVSVVEITADELEDIARIRSMLEGLATRQAVERTAPQTFAALLAQLETLQEQMEASLASGSTGSIASLNRDFHLLIYDLCGSPYLIETIRRIWMHQPGYIIWESPDLAAASIEQHKTLLGTLRAGHAESAARAMQVHIELSGLAFKKFLLHREEAKSG